MDNGQIGQQKDFREQALFTEGRGNEDPRSDSEYESRDNISTSNTGANWNAIGNVAINPHEGVKREESSVEYGDITDIDTTPGQSVSDEATEIGIQVEKDSTQRTPTNIKEVYEETYEDVARFKRGESTPAEAYNDIRNDAFNYAKIEFDRGGEK